MALSVVESTVLEGDGPIGDSNVYISSAFEDCGDQFYQ